MNNAFCDISSGIIVSDLTDHFPIYASISSFVIGNKSRQTVNPIVSVSCQNLILINLGRDWGLLIGPVCITKDILIHLLIFFWIFNNKLQLYYPPSKA